MPTNLAIDDELLAEAQRLGQFKTKKETVTQALRLFVQREKQKEILALFGTLDFDGNYDYKKHRQRREP